MKYQGLKDVELTRTASENTHVTGADRQPTRAVQPTETKYYLNPQGQIVDVGGDWDKFAWKGQAFEATADFVIGKYLADFIEGFETVS